MIHPGDFVFIIAVRGPKRFWLAPGRAPGGEARAAGAPRGARGACRCFSYPRKPTTDKSVPSSVGNVLDFL